MSALQRERAAEGDAGTTLRPRTVALAAAAMLALLPVARMTRIVLDGSPLQHADYWLLLPRFTGPDGGFAFGRLFELHNGHPLVVPRILYWLNVALLSGSNITLGLVVVALAVVQLGLVALVARRSPLTAIQKVSVVVASSFLLFGLMGTWNFAKAVSGVAWLSANLFALAAVYLASRDQRVAAFAVAALAASSYGTGIAAWIAVIAVGLSRRRGRAWWREAPHAAALAATYLWYDQATRADLTEYFDVGELLRSAAGLFGFVLGIEGGAGEAVGYVALVAVPLAVVATVLGPHGPERSAWAGIATFGFCATVVIASGRSVYIEAFGLQHRYYSLPAITLIGCVGLAFCWFGPSGGLDGPAEASETSRQRAGVAALLIAVPLALRSLTIGGSHADAMLDLVPRQELREIAFHLDLADDSSFVIGFDLALPAITERLAALDHYPFVDEWDRDCGLIGRRLPAPGSSGGSNTAGEITSTGQFPRLPDGVRLDGLVRSDSEVRCVVITDGRNEVIGAARLSEDTEVGRPGPSRFEALAGVGADVYRAHALVEDGPSPVRLDEVAGSSIDTP